MSNLFKYEIKTNQKQELINIDQYLYKALEESEIKDRPNDCVLSPHNDRYYY